jgi:hypothetical protein
MSATRTRKLHPGNHSFIRTKEKAMPSDLQIDKVNDQEIIIRLGGNSRVTKSTVTAEDLYEQLGKYLQYRRSAGSAQPADSPISQTADCIIDY